MASSIRETPRTEVIDTVISLFAGYTKGSSPPQRRTIINNDDDDDKSSRSSVASNTSRSQQSGTSTVVSKPHTIDNSRSSNNNNGVAQQQQQQQQQTQHPNSDSLLLEAENARLHALVENTSTRLEDTITILTRKAQGWGEIEQRLAQQEAENEALREQLASTRAGLEDQVMRNSILRQQLESSKQTQGQQQAQANALQRVENEAMALRQQLEDAHEHNAKLQQAYDALLEANEINAHARADVERLTAEIEELRALAATSGGKNQALLTHLRADKARLSALLKIEGHTEDAHYMGEVPDPNSEESEHWMQGARDDLQEQQNQQSSSSSSSSSPTPNNNNTVTTTTPIPSDWFDAPKWVPSGVLAAASRLLLQFQQAEEEAGRGRGGHSSSSSLLPSLTSEWIQDFLLEANEIWNEKLKQILHAQEKLFEKKLQLRTPFKEVLQASTITRLRATVASLQALLVGRIPPSTFDQAVTTLDTTSGLAPADIVAFGRHDSMSLNNTMTAKARLLSVPGSGGKRLDGHESAVLLAQAMECVEYLQKKIEELEKSGGGGSTSRAVTPQPSSSSPVAAASSIASPVRAIDARASPLRGNQPPTPPTVNRSRGGGGSALGMMPPPSSSSSSSSRSRSPNVTFGKTNVSAQPSSSSSSSIRAGGAGNGYYPDMRASTPPIYPSSFDIQSTSPNNNSQQPLLSVREAVLMAGSPLRFSAGMKASPTPMTSASMTGRW